MRRDAEAARELDLILAVYCHGERLDTVPLEHNDKTVDWSAIVIPPLAGEVLPDAGHMCYGYAVEVG